jgi:hypothetical protein
MTRTVRLGVVVAALRDAWQVGLAIAGILIATLVGVMMSASGLDRVRWAGMVLQLLGVGTVAWGVRHVRRLFGRPSVIEKTAAWFRRLLAAFIPPKPSTVQATAEGVATATGRVSAVVIAGPNASLERRVEVLGRNLDRLRDEMVETEKLTRQEIDLVRENLAKEQQIRGIESQRIGRQLEEMAVGALRLDVLGVLWLMLGVVGTSIPEEIAHWLSLVFSAA